MNLNEKDIIVLDDDKSYIIVKKTELDGINYYFISDINDLNNMKYLFEDGNELVEVDNDEILEQIIMKMTPINEVDDLLRMINEELKEQ